MLTKLRDPVSAVVLIMELTGSDRSFILPLLLIAGIAAMVSRTIEARSVYDARLSDEELRARQRVREHSIQSPEETPQDASS